MENQKISLVEASKIVGAAVSSSVMPALDGAKSITCFNQIVIIANQAETLSLANKNLTEENTELKKKVSELEILIKADNENLHKVD